MKTNLIKIYTIAAVSILFFSCKKEQSTLPLEPNVFSEEDYSTNESTNGFRSVAAANICCYTSPTNITRDPNFQGLIPSNFTGCNELKQYGTVGYNANWFAAPYSGNKPKVGVASCAGQLTPGACDSGYISFKGNKTNGQSISQDLQNIVINQVYHVQFNARIRPGSIGNAKVAIRLSNIVPTVDIHTATGAAYSTMSFKSPLICDTAWRCFKFDIQDNTNTYTVINIAPFNQYTGMLMNYAKVDIDNVKIWQ